MLSAADLHAQCLFNVCGRGISYVQLKLLMKAHNCMISTPFSLSHAYTWYLLAPPCLSTE